MDESSDHTAGVLEHLAEAASVLGTCDGPYGVAARVVSIALESAAGMARDGQDPVEEFTRIHGEDPLLRSLGRVAERRFPQSAPGELPEAVQTDPSHPAPDTLPFSKPPESLRELFEDKDSEP
jgi:hypothetical protein